MKKKAFGEVDLINGKLSGIFSKLHSTITISTGIINLLKDHEETAAGRRHHRSSCDRTSLRVSRDTRGESRRD